MRSFHLYHTYTHVGIYCCNTPILALQLLQQREEGTEKKQSLQIHSLLSTFRYIESKWQMGFFRACCSKWSTFIYIVRSTTTYLVLLLYISTTTATIYNSTMYLCTLSKSITFCLTTKAVAFSYVMDMLAGMVMEQQPAQSAV